MRKSTLFALLVFLLASCAELNDHEKVTPEPADPFDPALEVVLERLSGVIEDLYGPSAITRSGGRSFTSVIPVSPAATRSPDNPAPLAYIVNFDDNSGFALVSTDPCSDDIIAVSNRGNLDPDRLDRVYATVVSEYEEMIQVGGDGGVIDDMEDDPEDILYGDEHLERFPLDTGPFEEPFISYDADGDDDDDSLFLYVMLSDYLYSITVQRDHLDNLHMVGGGGGGGTGGSPEWGNWRREGGVRPLIMTKWHQDEPYNNNCPVMSDGDQAPTGCVTVAVGQIAAYYRKPARENWNVMSDFGVYVNGVYNIPPEHIGIIASYMHYLAVHMRADFGPEDSSIATSRAATYFRQDVDLDNVVRHGYSWARVSDRLNMRCPVYMHGFHGNGKGHAWIIDGYMYQRRYDTRPGYTYLSQSRTLLHINWGWTKGVYDGYYAEGVFDPSQCALTTDAAIGDGGLHTDGSAYTTRLKILTWKRP